MTTGTERCKAHVLEECNFIHMGPSDLALVSANDTKLDTLGHLDESFTMQCD